MHFPQSRSPFWECWVIAAVCFDRLSNELTNQQFTFRFWTWNTEKRVRSLQALLLLTSYQALQRKSLLAGYCDRRSVQWRTLKFEVRKTALQKKLTLKLVNKQPSGFRFHQVVWSQFWTTSKLLSAPETTTNNQEVKRSLYRLQNVNNLPRDYICMCLTYRSLAELFNFIGLV